MLKRRNLLALLAGVLAFALVVGAAASLGGITSSNLGADDSVVASCDTDGVTTAYTTVYNTTGSAGFKVDDVTVGAIAAPCVGDSMTITLTGAANASLASATSTVAAGTTTTVDLGSTALAEAVTGVHVVITD